MEVNCVAFEVSPSIYAPKLPLSCALDHNCVAIHGKELYKSAHGKHAVIASFSGMRDPDSDLGLLLRLRDFGTGRGRNSGEISVAPNRISGMSVVSALAIRCRSHFYDKAV
jgi:hypothetical protein